jgi:hypothetical protein
VEDHEVVEAKEEEKDDWQESYEVEGVVREMPVNEVGSELRLGRSEGMEKENGEVFAGVAKKVSEEGIREQEKEKKMLDAGRDEWGEYDRRKEGKGSQNREKSA